MTIVNLKGWFTHNWKIQFIYLPSSCSKPVRLLFIFVKQLKIFLMRSETFLFVH